MSALPQVPFGFALFDCVSFVVEFLSTSYGDFKFDQVPREVEP